MKRNLILITVFFSLGIAASALIKPGFLALFLAGAAVLTLACFLKGKPGGADIALLLFCFLVGGLRLSGFNHIPKDHILTYASYGGDAPIIVKGYVCSVPDYRHNKTCFKFSSRWVCRFGLERSTRGELLVFIKGKSGLKYGQSLILYGSLRRPFGKYGEYLKRQGIYAVFNVRYASRIIKLKENKGSIIRRFAAWLKDKAEGVISRKVSFPAGAIISAMVLGEKRNIPAAVNTAMVRTGTVHILVVSGFNVGLVSFMIAVLLKIIRLPQALRYFLAILLLLVYCFLTGASTPVVRATVMGMIFIWAYIFQREADIYNSLSLAALLILSFNPNQLFDIGFQLSFISVLSIIFLYPRFRSLVPARLLKMAYLRYLIEGLLVSLAAWLGTMGLIAYYFRIFSPVTLIANLFIVPAAALITLSGFSLIIAEGILPGMSHLFARFCELMVWALLSVNSLLLKIPGSSLSF